MTSAELQALLDEEQSLPKLAKRLEISRWACTKLCKEHHVQTKTQWFKALADIEFITLYTDAGCSCTAFAKQYNIDYETVKRRVITLGLVQKTYQAYDRVADYKITKEQLLQVLDACGGVANHMATALGVSHQCITDSCVRYNITLPSRPLSKISDSSIVALYDKANGNARLASTLCDYSHAGINNQFRRLALPVVSQNRSTEEHQICNLLDEMGINYCVSDKTVLGKYELDIYIPSKNIAIEVNGNYWHSERNNKTKTYHLDKTNLCAEQNIQLIHLFDDEIRDKFDLVSSKLKHILGHSTETRVYARACKIKQSNNANCDFINKHHIYGYGSGSITYEILYNNKIVGVMNFIKTKQGYKLNRYCTSCVVVGGFSKILKMFMNDYSPDYIETFADLRFTNRHTSVYSNIFTTEYITEPGYFYTDGNYRYSRQRYMKHKLEKIFPNYDSRLTEKQNCERNGLYRIWDVGHIKYVWRKQ